MHTIHVYHHPLKRIANTTKTGSKWIVCLSISLLYLYLLTGCSPYILDDPETPAEYCLGADELEPTPDPATTIVKIWAAAPRNYCWRAYAPVVAAENLPHITAEAKALNISMSESVSELRKLSFDERPDIAWVYSSHVQTLKNDNLIVNVDDCRERHAVFDEIRPELWPSEMGDTESWGIPSASGFVVLFYNKSVLAQVDWKKLDWADSKWTEEEWEAFIDDQLPEQIATGQFTLQHLIVTAEQAVEQGIVPAGLGFSYYTTARITPFLLYAAHGGDITRFDPNDFHVNQPALRETYQFLRTVDESGISLGNIVDNGSWTNRMMMHDALMRDQALFAVRSHQDWHYWVHDHVNGADNGEQIVSERIGMALFPSGRPEQSGVTLLGYPNRYVILATTPERQEAACDLLAETMKMENIGRHYLTFKNLPTFTSPDLTPAIETKEDEIAADLLAQLAPMWPHATQLSHDLDAESNKMLNILFVEYSALAESGKLTPDEAADEAIKKLTTELGDKLTEIP